MSYVSGRSAFSPNPKSPVPPEGQDGLFTQSWFPICLSTDVAPGQVKGYDFLDGRVVVFRNNEGEARVLSAYCPHMGADLSDGAVVNNHIRCAFHHWEYDGAGKCVKTLVGDAPPKAARLFKFPTVEKYGLVWAFNGEKPFWELPGFPYPDEELACKTVELPGTMPVDPWVQCCNTPDMQHIKALHGVTFGGEDPHDSVRWTDHSVTYDFDGYHVRGERVFNSVGVFGTSLYYQSTTIEGRWFGFMTAMGLPRPGHAKNFLVVLGKKNDGSSVEVEAWLDFVLQFEARVVGEDIPIMQGIRLRRGTLTKSDLTLGRYFDWLNKYPRAHPSADYIK
jgi:phenylpropionate dioxygenase-like ring-hydroxylating dioxygenase large terminal subunit